MTGNYIIAVDLGGTNLKVALLDLKYNIKAKQVLGTQRFLKKEILLNAIVNCINNLIKNNKLKRLNALGIGIGVPGPVNERTGLVHFFPNIPGWNNINLKAILGKRTGLPVFLDNDAKLMALAEHRLGAAKGFMNALCLTLGTGVGGGIIINGNLYRGSDNAAGEIGHLPINEDGPPCNCGGNACLEKYIGNSRLIKEARQLFNKDISLEELSAQAAKADKKALYFWDKVAGHLAVAITGAVNLLNLDAIVIGGGIANAGRVLFDRVVRKVKKRSMPVQAKRVKILKAKLGSDAGLIGAAILVNPAPSSRCGIKENKRA